MADKLAHVKQFYLMITLDGFGIRRHLGMDALFDDAKFLHNKVLPALYDAIKTDDPDYDPQGFHLEGKPGTEAKSTNAVRWFIELLEAHKAFEQLANRDHELIYYRMYQPGQDSCFLDDLRAALKADDPDWRA